MNFQEKLLDSFIAFEQDVDLLNPIHILAISIILAPVFNKTPRLALSTECFATA